MPRRSEAGPLSPDDLLRKIRDDKVLEQLFLPEYAGDVYLVGGALREMILGRVPKDYDIALSWPDDLKILELCFHTKAFILGKKPIQAYRMVKGPVIIDVTFLADTIERDLERRDFTMNALAFQRGRNTVIDPFGGIRDIAKGTIRTPATKNLADDPLRMVKAIRHFSMLPGFQMDQDLVAACKELAPRIHQSAPERIKYELDLIITASRSREALEYMVSTGLLFQIFPELEHLQGLDEKEKLDLKTLGHTMDGFNYLRQHGKMFNLTEDEVRLVGYALLFHDLGKAHTFSYDPGKKAVHFYHHEKHSRDLAHEIMGRLRFSTQDMRMIEYLILNHMRIFLLASSSSTEKGIRRLVYQARELIPHLMALTLSDLYGSSGGEDNPSTFRVNETCRLIQRAFEEWKEKPIPPLINGGDLLSLGFNEGPLVGYVLRFVRERQLGGEICERHDALEIAKTWLQNNDSVKENEEMISSE